MESDMKSDIKHENVQSILRLLQGPRTTTPTEKLTDFLNEVFCLECRNSKIDAPEAVIGAIRFTVSVCCVIGIFNTKPGKETEFLETCQKHFTRSINNGALIMRPLKEFLAGNLSEEQAIALLDKITKEMKKDEER